MLRSYDYLYPCYKVLPLRERTSDGLLCIPQGWQVLRRVPHSKSHFARSHSGRSHRAPPRYDVCICRCGLDGWKVHEGSDPTARTTIFMGSVLPPYIQAQTCASSVWQQSPVISDEISSGP